MSTTFGIVIKDGKELVNLPQDWDYIDILSLEGEEGIEIVEVFFRGSFGGIWENPLAQFLPKETKVYALDNTAQGIYTIGDLLKEE